jgi:hypothetical protein
METLMPAKPATAAKLASPAIKTSAPIKSTVYVCSKLPMSIELQLETQISRPMPGRFGMEPTVVKVKSGDIYIIRGIARAQGQLPKGYRLPRYVIEDSEGAAVTRGIPTEFWEQWMAENAETDMIKNRLVFAHADPDYLADEAREHLQEGEKNAGVVTGFEPLVPDRDPRLPRPIDENISKIETMER